VPDPFRSQQDSVVQIEICLSPITQRLPAVKYKGDIHPFFLLPLPETQQAFCIVNQRVQLIFITDEIKPYSSVRAKPQSMEHITPTYDQVRKLFFECNTVLKIPLQLFSLEESKDGVYDLPEKAQNL
jgi:hypothetical protein